MLNKNTIWKLGRVNFINKHPNRIFLKSGTIWTLLLAPLKKNMFCYEQFFCCFIQIFPLYFKKILKNIFIVSLIYKYCKYIIDFCKILIFIYEKAINKIYLGGGRRNWLTASRFKFLFLFDVVLLKWLYPIQIVCSQICLIKGQFC